MTLLPIVGRELRVASRRRGTYWGRTGSALAAVAVLGWILFVLQAMPPQQLGKAIFGTLSGLFLFVCLFTGVRHTADSLSEEKREGTLGLLFLTDLKGYDVVLGKLAATSLNVLYALLAIFPVLAISLLAGGVVAGEFWRMTLVLVNAIFFSLAAGMMVSAMSRSARKAMAATFLLVLIVHGALPALGAYWAYLQRQPSVHELFLAPSAGYMYAMAYDQTFATRPDAFWLSVKVTQATAWSFLLIASVVVRRAWQDRPEGVRGQRRRQLWTRWSYGNMSERRAFRTKLLDMNPCLWLGGRARLKPAMVWAAFGLIGCLWFWGALKWERDWFGEPTYLITALVIHSMLKIWLASEACQKFGPDRRSGALELLLSTPLSVREIVRGQLLALRRQFLGPAVIALLLDVILMVATLQQTSGSDETQWMWVWLALMATFAIDLWALAWTGLWRGLSARHANRAASSTIALVLVLPWTIVIAMLVAVSLTRLFRPIANDGQTAFVIGVAIMLASSAFFYLWSRHRLLHEMRTLASQRFAPARSILGWLGRFAGERFAHYRRPRHGQQAPAG